MTEKTHKCYICGEFETQDWDEFQTHRTREILDMIEANGGPEGLDLSRKGLYRIDLSWETIQGELARVEEEPGDEPRWVSKTTGGIDLTGINLQRANLVRANLRTADLKGADLWGTRLARADLQEAYLREADLQKANLGAANLQEASLMEAKLQAATLMGASSRGPSWMEPSSRGST
jgi:uncharacterized protein YjbI with pentapeptide repeats